MNTANGQSALQKNTTGSYNIANGVEALMQNTTGTFNTANGMRALYVNNGDYNIAIGTSALYNNYTGNNNTANGVYALYSNTTGSNNTALGYNAQVPNGAASNQVRIGDAAVTYAGIQVGWSITSDIRWKDQVRDLPYGLSFLRDLRPVDYVRKNNDKHTRETGFIAQEVEQTLKKYKYDDQGFLTKSDTGYLELRYNDFIAMIVRGVQEMADTLESLTNRVNTNESEIAALKISNETLKSANEKLNSANTALSSRLDAIEAQLSK